MLLNKISKNYIICAVTILGIGCSNKNQTTESSSNKIEPLLAHIDSSVKPSDDFFNFANGSWFKANPIPESETNNGIFLQVKDTVNNAIKAICENAAKNSNAA